MALTLTAACARLAAGQSIPDQRISVLNLVHTARQIQFEVQNNYTSAITFWQLRLHAACPDGSVAGAGGWESDALRTIAAGEDAGLFAHMPIQPIAPGARREFSFVRDLGVLTLQSSRIGAPEARDCDPSEFQDLTVIFADGTGAGSADLIAAHLAERHTQSETLKQWIGPLHDLLNADDPVGGLQRLRRRLDEEYEDCDGRVLRQDKLVRCGIMNREVRQLVNEQINQIQGANERPEAARKRVERMVGFWDRFEDLLAPHRTL
jgi:hypothetical protein